SRRVEAGRAVRAGALLAAACRAGAGPPAASAGLGGAVVDGPHAVAASTTAHSAEARDYATQQSHRQASLGPEVIRDLSAGQTSGVARMLLVITPHEVRTDPSAHLSA
ncbi:MAG TPA: hypothetical protein VGE94_12475, partial [Chloroflexota bacterium]